MMADAKGGENASPQTYYRYRDAAGTTVIVESLDEVPASLRASARRIEVPVGKSKGTVTPSAPSRDMRDLHVPSFLLGGGSVVALLLVVAILKRSGGILLKSMLVVGIVALLLGAYFGVVRRQAGFDTKLLSSPKELIDDAKKAADAVKERIEKEAKALERLEDTP